MSPVYNRAESTHFGSTRSHPATNLFRSYSCRSFQKRLLAQREISAFARKIRIVIRIALQNVAPTLEHNRVAARVGRLMLRCVPIKFCKWSVNNQVACALHFEAKIDIGKRFWQAFIESADVLQDVAAR